MYSRDDKLELIQRIGVTQEVYDILRKMKKDQKLSMAKIICNLILKECKQYENQ